MKYQTVVDENEYFKYWTIPNIPIYGSNYAKKLNLAKEKYIQDNLAFPPLTEKEADVISDYIFDSETNPDKFKIDFRIINSALRSERSISSDIQEIIDIMDNIIKRTKTSKNISLYRGIIIDDEIFKSDWEPFIEKKVERILFKGYTSTSISLIDAQTFWKRITDKTKILLLLRIPEGVHYHATKGFEKEVILPRNTCFRLIKNRTDLRDLINSISNQIDYVLEVEAITEI